MTVEALPIWTVYDRPRDHPHLVIVRRSWSWSWRWGTSTEMGPKPVCGHEAEAKAFLDLDEARMWLRSQGLYCLPRSAADDPVIVETWL